MALCKSAENDSQVPFPTVPAALPPRPDVSQSRQTAAQHHLERPWSRPG